MIPAPPTAVHLVVGGRRRILPVVGAGHYGRRMLTIRAPFAITPRPSSSPADTDVPVVGVTTFDKVFAGPSLVGTSVVQMVSAVGGTGPLCYVALERVEGSLDGVPGAFALQHVGVVVAGVPSLALEVVAGSGTDGLVGLSGSGTIEHTADGAVLTLAYSLPG